MTIKEAIMLLNPKTTAPALAGIEYYNGFSGKDACRLAIEAPEKQVPKKPRETRCALMCANCGHKITEKGCKKIETTAKNAVNGFYGR